MKCTNYFYELRLFLSNLVFFFAMSRQCVFLLQINFAGCFSICSHVQEVSIVLKRAFENGMVKSGEMLDVFSPFTELTNLRNSSCPP